HRARDGVRRPRVRAPGLVGHALESRPRVLPLDRRGGDGRVGTLPADRCGPARPRRRGARDPGRGRTVVTGGGMVTQAIPGMSTTDQAADVVLLAVPASGAWLGVLRTATASLASRLQFTLDEIEDLRIAVDEACAILLALASLDAVLSCRFTV